jgi:hypothetical protein
VLESRELGPNAVTETFFFRDLEEEISQDETTIGEGERTPRGDSGEAKPLCPGECQTLGASPMLPRI